MEVQLKQYKINNTKSKEVARVYRRERIELQKELFQKISETKEDMSPYEADLFMAEITPDIIDSVSNIGEWESYYIPGELERVYNNIYYETADIIASGIGGKSAFKVIDPKMIERAINQEIKGLHFSDRIWKNKEKLANRIYEDINTAIQEGVDVRKLAKELAKDFNTATYESMRLLQNETSRVINSAQDDIYEEAEEVEEVRYTATLDDLTTPLCQSLDGEVFSKHDFTKPRIPEDTHINCRSCYVPVVKGWSPTKRRDNKNKKYIEYVKYEDWKKR